MSGCHSHVPFLPPVCPSTNLPARVFQLFLLSSTPRVLLHDQEQQVIFYGGPFGTHYIACTSIAISAIERIRLGYVTMDHMAIVAKQHGRQFFRKGGVVRFVHVLHAVLCCRTPCITYIPQCVSHSMHHIHSTMSLSHTFQDVSITS